MLLKKIFQWQLVFITWKPWKSVDIKAVFSKAFQVKLIIIGYIFKLHSQVYIVFIRSIIHYKRKVPDLSLTHFIKMSSHFLKHQIKQRNKIGKVGERCHVWKTLVNWSEWFCPFPAPSCFLGWLFTHIFCTCIKAVGIPLPQFDHFTWKITRMGQVTKAELALA